MADDDLTNQLEDMFSDTAPEPEDSSLHQGIITDLLEGEVVTVSGAAVSAVAGVLVSDQTDLEAEEKIDGSLLDGVVAAKLEDESVSKRDAADSVMAEVLPHPTEELEEPEIPSGQKPAPTATPVGQRSTFLYAVPYVSLVLLGLLSISLLIGFIRPTLVVWSPVRVLFPVVCVVALAGMLIQWKLNSSLSGALRKAEEDHAEAVHLQTQLENRLQELNAANTLLEANTLEVKRANQFFHALSATREPDKLMQEAVDLVCDLFDLYYVGLFLIDESEQWAVLRHMATSPGTGRTGEFDHPMLSQDYQLEVGGTSMVGRCTAGGRVLTAPDLGEEAYHHNYTLLPGARAEMTLPLQSGGRTIGALDLQGSLSQVFSQESIDIFRTVVDQLATAIDNARALAALEARLDVAEEFQRRYKRDQRPGFILGPVSSHYERTQTGVTSASDKTLPEVKQAMVHRELIVQGDASHGVDQASLVTPITLRGEMIGALGFYEEHKRQWTADEIALVRDVTTQVALAVENVSLFEQTQTALEETDALYRASRAIAAADSVEDIVQAIVGSLTSPRVDQCYLGIFDSPGGKLSDDLVIVASWSRAGDALWQVGTLLSLNRDLMGKRMGRNQPLILSDVAAEKGLDGAQRDELVTAGAQSLAIVPLVAAGGWIGVLVVAASQAGTITEHNLQPYLTLAGQAALSIERSSLFKQTQDALEETSMLYKASRAIGAATSISKLAEVLLDAVAEGHFDRGLVLIRRQEDDKLEIVAGWDQRGHAVESGAVVDINQVPPNLMIYSDAEQVDELPNHRALDRASLLQDEVWRRWMFEGEKVTLASVPIQFRGELQGVLLIASRTTGESEHQLNERSLQPFVTLAAQAAVAIENRRLFEETRRAAEQEALLNEMLSNLATALNVPAIIRTVQEPLARLVPFDHMTVALVDQEMSTLEVYHPVSERAENGQALPKGQIASLQGTLSDQAISTRQTKVFDLTDPDLVGVEVEPLRRAGVQTCIIIPLVYGHDVLGSLSLAHSSPNTYTDADVPLLERVAQLTAIAVENARLFGQLSQRAVQLQTAAQVSQVATSILNLDQLLEQAVELIRDRFRLYYVGLFMVDARNESAVLQAGTGEAGRIQLERGHRLEIGGESMVGWCVANAQPRIALDVGEEAIHFDNPVLPETRSELALPLISRGETIGALSVQSTSPAAFSREDVTTLQTMAGQLANAIQNARFVEQTQEALAETEALYVASSELNSAQSYEDVLANLRQHTLVGQGAQNVSLNLFDHPWTDDQMPEWIEVLARWTQLLPDAFSPRCPLAAFPSAAQFLCPDLPTLIEDVVSDPRLDDHARALYLDRFGAKSTIFVPLVVGGQWIGFVNAIYQEATSFSETEVRRLIAISNQAAVAVQGLRQLQEIQARARREALIREITGKIRATTDLDTILQTTVAEVSKALGTSHGAIRLGVEESRGEGGQE